MHDQGWQERPIFGKIRFMNYKGCQRKFDVPAYVRKIKDLGGEGGGGGAAARKGGQRTLEECMQPRRKKAKTKGKAKKAVPVDLF